MFRNLLENAKNCQKIAVFEGENAFSYAELAKKANLLSVALPKNKRNVAMLLKDGADFVSTLWGIISVGLTAFPLNTLMTKHEILPLLKRAEVKTLVTSLEFFEVARELAKALGLEVIFLQQIFEGQQQLKGAPVLKFNDDTPALLLNTSGSTGNCKIVQLTEKNVQTSFLGYAEKMSLEKHHNYIYLLAVPFCSAYGVMILSACLMNCFSVVVFDKMFTLDALFGLAEKHKVTHYEGSTTAIFLMEQFGNRHLDFDISSLKYFGFGGSKIGGKTIETVSKYFPDKMFYQGYGMTEASPLIAKMKCGQTPKFDSVGTALTGVEIAVEVEGEIFHTANVTGEILVKGQNVMSGYFKNAVETKKVLKNGYLYTGDIGYLDEQGFLYICGRKKSLINSRGFKIFPEQVEQCILDSGLALDCVVYGKKSQLEREIVCADVVPANDEVTAEEIFRYCKTHLADFKQPQQIVFCQQISKKASGKVDRTAKNK